MSWDLNWFRSGGEVVDSGGTILIEQPVIVANLSTEVEVVADLSETVVVVSSVEES